MLRAKYSKDDDEPPPDSRRGREVVKQSQSNLAKITSRIMRTVPSKIIGLIDFKLSALLLR